MTTPPASPPAQPSRPPGLPPYGSDQQMPAAPPPPAGRPATPAQHPAQPLPRPAATPQYPAGPPSAYPGAPGAPAAQHPGAPAPQPAASPRRSNPFGLVSILASAVILLSMMVQLAVQVSMVARGDYEALAIAGGVSAVLDGLLAITAITFGVIGLTQRGRPHTLAGIGVGIGVATLFSTLVWGLIYPGVLNLV